MHILLIIKIVNNIVSLIKKFPEIAQEEKKVLSQPLKDLVEAAKEKNFEKFEGSWQECEKGLAELISFCAHEELKPFFTLFETLRDLLHKHGKQNDQEATIAG